jgi:hypothetical protein
MVLIFIKVTGLKLVPGYNKGTADQINKDL